MHFRTFGRAWIRQLTSVLLSFTLLSSYGLVAFKTFAQKRAASARTEVNSNSSNQITKAASHTEAKTKGAGLVSDFGNLPLSFEANRGQAKPEVKFLARGRGYGFLLTKKEAVLLFERGIKRTNGTKKTDVDALGFTLVNSNSDSALSGSTPLPGTTNYFLGNDQSKWRTNVPSFSQVKSENIYDGIDMLYRGNGHALEFDFAVAPNADPSLIKVRYRGAKHLSLTADGDLSIKLPGGTLVQHKPVAYQNIGGKTKPVTASYRLIGKTEVAFTLGSYDKNEELVIDPTLTYSTYLGGSRNDRARSVGVDASGNIYIAGETLSSDFPVAGAFQSFHFGSNAYYDAFVTKLNPSGSTILYSTYLGGSTNDEGLGIAVDSSGAAYVTGYTDDTDYPTTAGSVQPTSHGGIDGFVTKLSASGSALVYSTFFGGTNNDLALNIALNSSGEAYITGYTQSTNFPTVNPIRPTFGGGTCGSQPCEDAFVAKINASGSAALYSTYLGGSNADRGADIAVDSNGAAFVTGFTQSTNFPTSSPLQGSLAGNSDGFLTAINPAGSAFLYSTYLGGSGADSASAIAVDSSGNVYLTGSTASTNFPTASAYDSTLGNQSDAFVTKIASGGGSIVFSTFLGGTVDLNGATPDNETGMGIVVDSTTGDVWVAGDTDRIDFPLLNPVQTSNGGSWDVFVGKFNATGGLVYSTYIGGIDQDVVYDLARDSSGSLIISGMTVSLNFPTVSPVQSTNHGGNFSFTPMDGTVLKLSDADGPQVSGQVTDPGSNPVSFVTVKLTGAQTRQTLTDASGNYSFPNVLPGGNYTITPLKTNYTFAPTSQSLTNVTANQTVNFTANINSVTLNGKVKDANSAGVSGVTVTLSGSQSGSQVTDTTGNYSFTNLPAGGTYTVTPTRSTDTFVPANKTFSNLGSDQTTDFTLVYAITGTVTNASGVGTGGVDLTLSGPQTAATQTDASGNYSFTNLPANGTYTVTPSKISYLLAYNFNPLSRSIVLSSNQVGNFSFTNTTQVTVNPIADAYVEDGTNAATNFGTVTPLLVKTANQTGQRRYAYLKFDLTPVARSITTVKLRIFASLSAAGSVGTSAYSVADTTWGETSINWNNKPNRTAITGANATVTTTTNAWYDIDVTTYVKAEKAAGRDIVSLALQNGSNSTPNIFLNSREAGTGKPELVVITSDNNNSAPTVSLTTPTNGSSFNAPANVPLSASASDTDGTISKVEYFSGTTSIGSSTTSPYNVTWPSVPIGNYSIVAVATDNNGAVSISTASNITVGVPNNLPSVSWVAPLTNSNYGAGANISLSADAFDVDGSINKVEFFNGANLIGTATVPSSGTTYSVVWNNVAVGAYSVTAKATDNLLGVNQTSAITINVVGAAGLSPVADAYVKDGASAGTNFGTALDLQSQVSAGSNSESYLRFDINTVTAITKARLRVFGRLSDASGTNVPVGVYAVANTTWIESGAGSVTWNTKLSLGAQQASTTVTNNVNRWYEFDISSYVQSEKAAGRNLISLAIKNLATSSPYTTFNSREATNNRPQLVLWTTQPRNVLFAVGSTNLNAGDNAVKTRLQNLGFTVTVKLAGTNNNAINTVDADGKALVVISSTVLPANVTNKFRFVPVPVLIWESDLLDDMGMTGLTSGTDFGVTGTTQTSVNIVTPSHPMAAGQTGTPAVVSTATTFGWGVANVNSIKIAALASDASKFAIFGYDNGVTMPGLDAPTRRVSLFMTDLTAGNFNTAGGALFDAAAKWVTDVATAPTIVSLTPTSGPIGNTVTISGYNFGGTQGANKLTFNGATATASIWNEAMIVATVPQYSTTGPVVVVVNGVSSNAVTFTVGDVDSDADGLPDWWEQQYFGNLSHNGTEDADGDGLTNLQEYQQGRNPTVNAQPDDGTGVNLKLYTPLRPPN